ncbi:DUF2500 domain-containing protein [Paucisalibacillus sp. EB02]|uniref:DUF2500 domain-containing protein n=1 Tax=Paucisalibacillus sp. EB02 TaxID=1347087 RepID=UPI0004B7E67D|nr:DUF2500 domain-containing protein [Paucisalibacillus sp. EB02]
MEMGYSMDPGFSFFEDLFPIIFGLIFIIILLVFITGAFKGVSEWRKNEQSPQLSVPAIIKSKRTNVSHHHGNDHHGHTSTTYYATFEFDSGDRQEFRLSAREYGQIAENDLGILTFQGSRFLGFERSRE